MAMARRKSPQVERETNYLLGHRTTAKSAPVYYLNDGGAVPINAFKALKDPLWHAPMETDTKEEHTA